MEGPQERFGAVGRVSPTYYVQDGVVPRTRIAPTLRFIGQVAARHGLTISNIFHAGDGNLHPIILFDPRKPGDLQRRGRPGERSCNGALNPAARSPASTESAWKRMS